MPLNGLYGDVRHDELRQLLAALLAANRFRTDAGPLRRVQALGWLFYPFR
jgi:hypothetical protein